MAQKVNLNKLKEEIDSRKRGKGVTVPSHLGESHADGTPKDKFLNGLLVSLKTGRDTASSNLIKTVDNTVSKKLNETPKLRVSENVQEQPRPIPKPAAPVDMSPEREEQMWREFQQSKKQTLAEQMSGFMGNQNTGGHGYQQPQQPMYNQQGQPMMNEGALINNVKSVVDKYLMENFGGVVEEAIKSTILEMYAAEKIKEVLEENRNLIKSVVIDTIREIQDKNKAKKA